MFISRHVAFCSSINKIHMLNTITAFCCTSCIHGCIAAADDNHILADGHLAICAIVIFKECQCILCFTALKLEFTAFVSTNSKNYAVIFFLQNIYGRCFCVI